jgi:hypothetical protein
VIRNNWRTEAASKRRNKKKANADAQLKRSLKEQRKNNLDAIETTKEQQKMIIKQLNRSCYSKSIRKLMRTQLV